MFQDAVASAVSIKNTHAGYSRQKAVVMHRQEGPYTNNIQQKMLLICSVMRHPNLRHLNPSFLCQALPGHFQCTLICFVTPNKTAGMYKDAARNARDIVQVLVSDAHPSLG